MTMIHECKAGDRVRLEDGVNATVVFTAFSRKHKYSSPVSVLRDDQPPGKLTEYHFPYKIGCPGNSVEVLTDER